MRTYSMSEMARRTVDRIGESLVSIVALGLYGLAGGYAVAIGGPALPILPEVALPILVGTGLLWYDRRRSSPDIDDRVPIVGLSMLACILGAVAVSLWSVTLLWLRTGAVAGGLQPLLSAVSVGAGFGVILGHVYVELSHHYRENDRLSRAVDASRDGIAIVEDDRHSYVNDAYASLYDETKPSLEGRPWDELYTPESRLCIEREVRPALSDRESWRGRLTGKRANGTTVPLDVTVSTLERGCIVVARDIRDTREREQRIQVLNRVLRHNLRNAVTVIKGHTDFVRGRDDQLDEQHVEPIVDRLNELLATADKAREIERTLGSPEPSETIAAPNAVRSVIHRATAEYPDAQITTQIEKTDETPPIIDARIVDALNELVDNAIQHYTEETPPTIDICFRTIAYGADPVLEFTVADNGSGIPRGERRSVTDGRETPLEHGSGLGLWFVNWIVANAGGDLRFDDRPSGGTVVTLTFPYELPATDEVSEKQLAD